MSEEEIREGKMKTIFGLLLCFSHEKITNNIIKDIILFNILILITLNKKWAVGRVANANKKCCLQIFLRMKLSMQDFMIRIIREILIHDKFLAISRRTYFHAIQMVSRIPNCNCRFLLHERIRRIRPISLN